MSDKENLENIEENIETAEAENVVDAATEAAEDTARVAEVEETVETAETMDSINFDVVYDDETESDEATEDESPTDVVDNNAEQVNETFALAQAETEAKETKETEETAKAAPAQSRSSVEADSATTVSSQLDHEIKRRRKKDNFFLKSNPTFKLDHVTVTNRKTGRNILDDLSLSFQAGSTHAVLVDEEDTELHQILLATMVGMVRADRGNVMHKSTNIADIEPLDLLGHRFGFMPQRFAMREDLDAEGNLLYAMEASNRNFLKPKPVIARDLLKRVGFTEVTSGLPIGKLSELDKRRVAIARTICCEAEVIIVDEPTAGLDDEDAAVVLDLLKKFKRDADRKRAIIVVTSNPDVADAMEHTAELY
jgi:putative ABC transport system ATP-binding protein